MTMWATALNPFSTLHRFSASFGSAKNPLRDWAITQKGFEDEWITSDGNPYKSILLSKGMEPGALFEGDKPNWVPCLFLKSHNQYQLLLCGTHWLLRDGEKRYRVSDKLNALLFALAAKAILGRNVFND
ncbi:MAG: hypothetical protein U0003_00150 [Vampirovibrionales bacterium]